MITSTLLSEKEHLIEIGDKAVWSLTSVKPGNGVEKLRDDNLDTFWQSDGVQPHKITIQFHKIVKIQEIAIYVDLKHDESYTPKELLIKGGYDLKDLKDIITYNVSSPDGWQRIKFEKSSSSDYLQYNVIQIVIIKNFQNGRDTHLRQIKIFGPQKSEFKTKTFQTFSDLR
eukprot:gene3019-5029_t